MSKWSDGNKKRKKKNHIHLANRNSQNPMAYHTPADLSDLQGRRGPLARPPDMFQSALRALPG